MGKGPRQTRLIGLVGGMSSESSTLYYQFINREMHRRLGGHHNARSVLFTLDFDELNAAAAAGRWEVIAERVADAIACLKRAGAEFAMITSVTAHRVADEVEAVSELPLLHIADPMAAAIRRAKLSTIGLLATRYTVEQDFLRQRLERKHGLSIIAPPSTQQDELQRIIIDELTAGIFSKQSRATLMRISAGLRDLGAQGTILGCTELPLLVAADDMPLPTFDAALLHARAAVDLALGGALYDE